MRSTLLVTSLAFFLGTIASPLVPRGLEMSPVPGVAGPVIDVDKRQVTTTASLRICSGAACGGNCTTYPLPGGPLSTCHNTPQYNSAYVTVPSTADFVVYPHIDCTGFGALPTNVCVSVYPFANGYSVEPLSATTSKPHTGTTTFSSGPSTTAKSVAA
ncbi:hypothetical protein DL93DRAFT_219653 [Clavulina sp. PMI_390]|nr:hypothetical protein DL93DRAFT_219653 [Clavulina sp. PMI_390]